MSDKTEKTNDVETGEVPAEEPLDAEAAQEAPVAKSKKEIKKERKELKKHKKEVKKDAKRHSRKRSKAQTFFLTLIMIFVIIAMVACSVMAIKAVSNLGKAAEPEASQQQEAGGGSSQGSSTTPVNTPAAATPTPQPNNSPQSGGDSSPIAPEDESKGDAPAAEGGGEENQASSGVPSTKEEIVEYYKTAHAKALSSAKKATRTYDNTSNYNDVLEVGGNSTLAGIAKQLMGMFVKENTEPEEHTSDIADALPPAGGCAGLTPDMISEATCTEDGGNYIIKMTIDSTEENPDLGDKTKNLTQTVSIDDITNAASGFIEFEGVENRYVGANITATVDKETGNLTALETDVPSYMFFGKVSAMKIVNVENCRIGLEYQQKWTIEY